MAASFEESSKDTSQMTSTNSVEDTTENEKAESVAENAKIPKDYQ